MVSGIVGAIGQGAVVAVTIKAIDQFSSTFKKASTGIGKISTIAKVGAGAVAGLALAIGALGVSAVKSAADFEQTTVAFTTMLGSGEEAKRFLEELANFAKTTPFTLPGVERSARQLLAVGFEAKDVLPVLRDVGNVAAGLGLGEEGLQRLILNLGQVQSQGKLTGRELRDFAVAGVPLLEELSKELGKTTAEVQDLISKGEIETDVVLKAFNNMASAGGRFADLMEKQAETVQGKFSNLKDTFELMKRELGKELLPVVAELADVFLNDVLPAMKPLIPVLAGILKAVARIAVALAPLIDLLAPVVELLLKLLEIAAKVAGGALGLLFKGVDKAARFLTGLVGGDTRRVGDAIIRPNGQIIETSPDDTIFATKNPGAMGGVVINIDRVQGVDPDDISEALASKLSLMIKR